MNEATYIMVDIFYDKGHTLNKTKCGCGRVLESDCFQKQVGYKSRGCYVMMYFWLFVIIKF